MKTDEQVTFALGLAQKAGKLASGDQGIWDMLKKQRARYVLIAADASPRTREKLENWCRSHHIPYSCRLDMQTMGAAIGKAPRAAVVILDDHFLKLFE